MRQEHVLVDAKEERCVLVGVITHDITETQATEYIEELEFLALTAGACLLYTSPSPRDGLLSRMPSSA